MNDRDRKDSLKIRELYSAILGESLLSGVPCVIVRLTGCNLRCSYCDTTYAYKGGRYMTPAKVADAVKKQKINTALITGGEPLFQPGSIKLMSLLVKKGFETVLETNGSVDVSSVPEDVHIVMDLKTPGSNCCEHNLISNLDALKPTDEIKLVLVDRKDYLWARRTIKDLDLASRFSVTLSPAYGLLKPDLLAKWILQDMPDVRLGLQIHKYVFGKNVRRV